MHFWLSLPPDLLDVATKCRVVRYLVGGRYRLKKKLGSGSFGTVYIAKDVRTGEDCAVKMECKKTAKCLQLSKEARIYQILKGISGIPAVHFSGCEGDYNLLVLDLEGPNLKKLFEAQNKSFSLKTVITIADHILTTIETIHDLGVVHRDIKPNNFVTGRLGGPDESYIKFIDFGLATEYRDPFTGKHVPFRDGRNLTGTPRYASINNHKGVEPTRRDDIESIAYVLLQFMLGSLPWENLGHPPGFQVFQKKNKDIQKQRKRERFAMIGEKKASISVEELCQNLPFVFTEYLLYCHKLEFDERPDYRMLRESFRQVYRERYGQFDYVYDWCVESKEDDPPKVRLSPDTDRPERPEKDDEREKPLNFLTTTHFSA